MKFLASIPEIDIKANYYNIDKAILQTILVVQSNAGQSAVDGNFNYGRVLAHARLSKYPIFSTSKNGFVVCTKRGRGVEAVAMALNILRGNGKKTLTGKQWSALVFGPGKDLHGLAAEADKIYSSITGKTPARPADEKIIAGNDDLLPENKQTTPPGETVRAKTSKPGQAAGKSEKQGKDREPDYLGNSLRRNDSLYANTYQHWAKDFIAGDYPKALTAIEENLQSGDPHPLAPSAWLAVQKAGGNMDSTLWEYKHENKANLDLLAELDKLYSENKYGKIYENSLAGTYKSVSDYYAIGSEVRAIEKINPDLAYELIERLYKMYPESFQVLWLWTSLLESVYPVHTRLSNDLKTGKFAGSPLAESYLTVILQRSPLQNFNEIDALRSFIKKRPDDAMALRYLGKELQNQERYDEAISCFQRSFELDPFYGYNLESKALCLAKLLRFDEAWDVCKLAAKLYSPNDEEKNFYGIWASVLIDAGDFGKARTTLDEALKKFAEFSELMVQYGRLETNSERYKFAIPYWEKALNTQPDNISYAGNLVNVYFKGGENLKAAELTNSFREKKSMSEYLYGYADDIFIALSRPELAEEILLEGIDKYPYSASLKRALTEVYFKQEKMEEALKALEQSFAIDPANTWAINKYVEILDKQPKKDKAVEMEKKLTSLVEQNPWVEHLWDALAEKKTGDIEKIAVYEKAIEKNPGNIFPYSNIRQVLTKNDKWNDIAWWLKKAEQAITGQGSRSDVLLLYFEKAAQVLDKSYKTMLTEEEFDSACANLNRYYKMGGFKYAYHYYMAQLLQTIDRKKEAAMEYDTILSFRPDEYSLIFDLVTKFNDKYPRGKANRLLYQYVDRSPYSNRLANPVHLGAMWTGQYLNGLRYAKLCKERAPEAYSASNEAMIFGKLGDCARDYEISYKNQTSIGSSFRYVGWYNNTRHRAWKGATRVEVDYERNIASIIYPDGTIVKRQDDSVSGLLTRLEIGPAYIFLNYDDAGNLLKIGNSAGKTIDLGYNEKDQIDKLTSSTGTTLYFEYNELSKPTKIKKQGAGLISVTYDSGGSVDEVTSFNEDGSEGNPGLPMELSQAFQDLTNLIGKAENLSSLSPTELPDLGVVDLKYEGLKTEYDSLNNELNWGNANDPKRRKIWLGKGLELCRYLLKNIANSATYGPEGIGVLAESFEWIVNDSSGSAYITVYGTEITELFYDFLYAVRQRGIDTEIWNKWTDMQNWLEDALVRENKQNLRQQMVDLLTKIKSNPIELLETSFWLPHSFLQNKGYWRKFDISDLTPRKLAEGLQVNAVHYRGNGDILLGTSKGLCVMRKGFWEWFGYDELMGEFRPDLPSGQVRKSSEILSIIENQGFVYLGTANGLLQIGGEYNGKITRRWTDADGLPSLRVERLEAVGSKLLIGTTNGLNWLTEGKFTPAAQFAGKETRFLKSYHDERSDLLLAGTEKGVFAYSLDKETGEEKSAQLTNTLADDALTDADGMAYTLFNGVVNRLKPVNNKDGLFQRHVEIPIRGNILKTARTYGLANIPVNDGAEALGVLTDQGISLYHQRHYEHFALPFSDEIAKAKLLKRKGNGFTTVSDRHVFIFERNKTEIYNGSIKGLLTNNEIGVTFIAGGRDLKYLVHNDSSGELNSLYYFGSTDKLVMDNRNRLICNNGNEVMRFTFTAAGKFERERLFDADPYTVREFRGESKLTSLLVASDGTIWVTAGASVFRYRDQTEVQEFNFFKDPGLFPSRTYYIDKIVETTEGRILVVGSNESHLYYKGISMRGGLLQWNAKEEKFERIDPTSFKANTYITSYTAIDDQLAILGTVAGFAREKNGVVENFKDLKDPSYDALLKDHPSLFLGTKGKRIGEDIWLFGCGAGIVAYNQNTKVWFYPDRLNWMLPEDLKYGNYGGRHVNALETDAKGRIYVGTDLGLLVYDCGKADPMSFLISSFNEEEAFAYQNTNTIRQEAEILLDAIPGNSKNGQIIADIRRAEKDIQQIEKLTAIDVNSFSVLGGNPLQVVKPDSVLGNKLDDMRKRHARLLTQLEREEPGLYQLLEVKPLDVYSFRSNLKENEVVIQYLPTRKRLFIQVLSKKQIWMVEQILDEDELMKRCRSVSELLTDLAKYDYEYIKDIEPERNRQLNRTLAELYDMLLRPVEKYLDGYENIHIIPVKQLYYVPFAALVSRYTEHKSNFAVEKYNIGYITSMHLLNLLMRNKDSAAEKSLLMGDPNGDLKGARKEIEKINTLLKSDCCYAGNLASIENLKANVKGRRYVHLATHGELNTEKPEESTLEFAGHRKLNVIDAMHLPLDDTDLVVLSACQSGIGREGMEYATLARSFTLAGASNIIASLWQVEDGSSEKLMYYLYGRLLEGKSRYAALADAQRQMIISEDIQFRHPSKWAAYITIGKP